MRVLARAAALRRRRLPGDHAAVPVDLRGTGPLRPEPALLDAAARAGDRAGAGRAEGVRGSAGGGGARGLRAVARRRPLRDRAHATRSAGARAGGAAGPRPRGRAARGGLAAAGGAAVRAPGGSARRRRPRRPPRHAQEHHRDFRPGARPPPDRGARAARGNHRGGGDRPPPALRARAAPRGQAVPRRDRPPHERAVGARRRRRALARLRRGRAGPPRGHGGPQRRRPRPRRRLRRRGRAQRAGGLRRRGPGRAPHAPASAAARRGALRKSSPPLFTLSRSPAANSAAHQLRTAPRNLPPFTDQTHPLPLLSPTAPSTRSSLLSSFSFPDPGRAREVRGPPRAPGRDRVRRRREQELEGTWGMDPPS